jgi:hypothetical protein
MGGSRVEKEERMREKKKFSQTCKDDIDKFCEGVNPGQGGIVTCLKERVDKLSAPCRERVNAMTDERKR